MATFSASGESLLRPPSSLPDFQPTRSRPRTPRYIVVRLHLRLAHCQFGLAHCGRVFFHVECTPGLFSRSPLSLLPAGFTEVAGWDVDSVAGWLALINQKESVDAFRGESRRSTPNPCPQEPNNKTPLHCDSLGACSKAVGSSYPHVSPHRQSLDGTKWPLARRGQSKRATPTSPRIDTGHHPLPPPPPPSLSSTHDYR